jgi:hypothetical protein
MMCKYRGETPLSQRWMAETMIKAGFYMRWPWGTPSRHLIFTPILVCNHRSHSTPRPYATSTGNHSSPSLRAAAGRLGLRRFGEKISGDLWGKIIFHGNYRSFKFNIQTSVSKN